MLIVVNHLTRMKPGYFCAAGINKSTDKHIRPIIRFANLSVNLLAQNGGPFDMASLVDLGEVSFAGSAPEMEDHHFYPKYTRLVRHINPDEFWKLISRHSKQSLKNIFGPELKQRGKSCVVECGSGAASLGCLSPPTRPRLYINNLGKIRITLNDGTFQVDLSITDLRLYEVDNTTPDKKLVYRTAKQIQGGEKVILGMGLTRPWRKEGDADEWHWLQVNNIHLEGNPAWRISAKRH